jgi:NhaA family Na+:H+ antiporter
MEECMATKESPKLTVPVGVGDHIQGPDDAPITLVEYGDYQCPYCKQAYEYVREMRDHLGERLRYVYRHLPISDVHPHAFMASEAAEAAGAQGLFWEMHSKMYEGGPLSEGRIYQYAQEIGLDMDRFRNDLKEHKFARKVRLDYKSGLESRANGTPTFYLNGKRYDEPWDLESMLEAVDKPLGMRVQLLTQEFTRIEASGGILLLLATLIALLWANSGLSDMYFQLWQTKLTISFGEAGLGKYLLAWVNDGLMAIFFFVVGLEIKREVTAGELASLKRAALPLAGAIGGLLTPALIYTVFNWGGPGASGWGIPMATDIAFTLGILTVMGKRVPLSLKVFFTAMAIADDLGAVLVIALFYSSGIQLVALAVGGGFLLALVGLNRARVYSPLPYGLLGIGLWLAFLESGVHPTIAGVLLAMTIPTRSPVNMRGLLAQTVTLLNEFNLPPEWRTKINIHRQATVSTLRKIVERMQPPAQRLEVALHPWTTYLILPIFALANAGVALGQEASFNLTSPISLGIILGLVLGKPLGISLFSWSAMKIGVAELPADLSWRQFFSASWLAGIGFTISLFIAGSAFEDPALQTTSKIAILLASLLAAGIGSALLVLTSRSFMEVTQVEGEIQVAGYEEAA